MEIVDGDPRIAVIAPEIRYGGQKETEELALVSEKAAEQGAVNIILDFGKVAHLNAIAIGNLVGLEVAIQRKGGRIILLNVDRRIENVFVITKLSLIFEVAKTRDDALAAIRGHEAHKKRR